MIFFEMDICLQAAERAINDIDVRVKSIAGTARQLYSQQELAPHLDQLERASTETREMMGQLGQALQCQPIFRSGIMIATHR